LVEAPVDHLDACCHPEEKHDAANATTGGVKKKGLRAKALQKKRRPKQHATNFQATRKRIRGEGVGLYIPLEEIQMRVAGRILAGARHVVRNHSVI